MNIFTDKNGKKWIIEINIGQVKVVRAMCEFDILKVMRSTSDGLDTTEFSRLADDPVLLVDIIYALCKRQADEAGISAEKFAELFDANAIDSAGDALVKEIINFTQPVSRKVLEKLYERSKRLAEENGRRMLEILESPEMEKELETMSSGQSMNLQESSVSTQTPSP